VPAPRNPHTPSLRRHAPSRQTVVTLSGRDHYLGPWPDGHADQPPEAKDAYDRLIARWLAGQRQPLPTAEDRRRRALAGADLDGGAWPVGCRFDYPLADDELRAVVGG
jgi:hypothetical protein